jgi:hypothetical protein
VQCYLPCGSEIIVVEDASHPGCDTVSFGV